MTTANILQIHLSSLKNNMDCTKQILQKQSLLNNELELPPEIKEATIALRIAQKNCRRLIQEQRTKKTVIDDEQEAAFVAMNPVLISRNGRKTSSANLPKGKDTKQMMSQLPSKMNCPGGISSILVPLPKEGIELEYLVITEGLAIERLILQRNIRHFRQAESTPLATTEVIGKIGFSADTTIAEHILEGKADPTDITDDKWSR
jgi:hypothetical protein